MSRPHKRKPGTFVFLAHDFYRHHKVLELAHAKHHRAILVALLALSWCGDNRTDGWVPKFALPAIMGRESDATHLVDVGLWTKDAGGWWIHDWLEWQQTNEDRAKLTEKMSERANIRWHGHPDGPGPTVAELDARRNA